MLAKGPREGPELPLDCTGATSIGAGYNGRYMTPPWSLMTLTPNVGTTAVLSEMVPDSGAMEKATGASSWLICL